MATEEKETDATATPSVKDTLSGRLKDYEVAMKDRNLSPHERREAQLNVQALRRVIRMF